LKLAHITTKLSNV